MEKIEQIGLVLLLVVVIIGAYFAVPYVMRLSFYGYAKSVPVQVGYDTPTSYWIISGAVTEQVKLVLVKGSTTSTGTNEQAKTQSEVGLLVTPEQPYSKTNMEPMHETYKARFPTYLELAPAYDINDANWLITVVYDLGVYKNGIAVVPDKRHEFDYTKERNIEVKFPTSEGVVIVKNLGMLPQGVSVPSGDLIVVKDPDGDNHIFNKVDFTNALRAWNDRYPFIGLLNPKSWTDVWNELKDLGWLPHDVQLAHVSSWQVTTANDYITLTYRDIVFAGDITVYIPSDLADTVIIQILAAKPQIVQVVPDPFPPLEEGKKSSFSVTVKNIGTQGTITVSPSSDRYAFTALTPTFKNMKAGESFVVSWDAYALNVESDTGPLVIKIFAQGEGGTATYNLKTGGIRNVEGYTPPTPEPTTATLLIYVKDVLTQQPVSDITVTVVYGSKTATTLSSSDGTLSFDLGAYTGSVQISTQATAQYGEAKSTAEVKLGKNEHTILLSQTWLAMYWWVIVIIVVVVIAVAVIIWYRREE